MPEYYFLTGEVFRVQARDAEHAQNLINAYFNDEYPEDLEADGFAIDYVEGTTILLDDYNED